MTTINGLKLPDLKKNDPTAASPHAALGTALAVVGLIVVMFTAIANWVSIGNVGSDPGSVAETTMWAGGFGILGLGTIKVAVAIVLVGIILGLWNRVSSMRDTVPQLQVREGARAVRSRTDGVLTSDNVPDPLPIHKMATRMWAPMLLMGAMLVMAGAIVRVIAAGEGGGTESFRETAAWGIGVEFLGEAMLLSGISFLLGTILASLRQGGSEVQHVAGAKVKVLAMPPIGKAFIALMMMGLMIGIGQFATSLVLAGKAADPTGYAELAAFVGPLREFSLGIILAGIVLALVNIGNVLDFQFTRIRELARLNQG